MQPTRPMTAMLATLLLTTLLGLSGCIAQGDDLQGQDGADHADGHETDQSHEDEVTAEDDGADAGSPEHQRTAEPHYADGLMLSMSDRTFTWDVPADAGKFWVDATWSLGSMTDVKLEDPDGEVVTLADTMTGDAQTFSTVYETEGVTPGTWSIHVDTMTYAYVQFEVWY